MCDKGDKRYLIKKVSAIFWWVLTAIVLWSPTDDGNSRTRRGTLERRVGFF